MLALPFIRDRTSRQKISKKTEDLNNIINQLDITDIMQNAQQQHNIHSAQVHMRLSPEIEHT